MLSGDPMLEGGEGVGLGPGEIPNLGSSIGFIFISSSSSDSYLADTCSLYTSTIKYNYAISSHIIIVQVLKIIIKGVWPQCMALMIILCLIIFEKINVMVNRGYRSNTHINL